MSKLQRLIDRLYKTIKPVSNVANGISMVILTAMMLLTAVDVILRKTLNMPIIGAYEVIQFMMGITVSFGLAWCGLEKGHACVDIIENRLSERTLGKIGILTGFLSLVCAGLMTWQTGIYITKLYNSQLLSQVLLLPVYPFVALVALGIAMYTIVLLIHLLEFIQRGVGK